MAVVLIELLLSPILKKVLLLMIEVMKMMKKVMRVMMMRSVRAAGRSVLRDLVGRKKRKVIISR